MANLFPIILNGVYSTVQAGSSAIGSSTATGINVATGDGAKFGTIGTSQYIPAVVVDGSTSPETVKEFVWVTAIATDALTVVRQSDDSSRFPASTTTVQAGYTIAAIPSAQVLSDAWKAGGSNWFRSGYYSPGQWQAGNSISTQALTLSAAVTSPFMVPARQAFDRIGVNVSVAATGGSGGLLRMGIYADGGGQPGALVVDAGTISSETTGAKEIVISQTLAPGTYWLAVVAQVAACTVSVWSSNNLMPMLSSATTPLTNSAPGSFRRASVTAGLPDPFAATSNAGSPPVVGLRAA